MSFTILELTSEIYYIFDFPMMNVKAKLQSGVIDEITICCELIDTVLESVLPYEVGEKELNNVQLRLF